MQLVPHLGRYAKHLYVFQRTPSSVDVRGNEPTDPQWATSLQPGWQKERQRNFHRWSPFEGVVFDQADLVCDFWTELGRNMTARIAASDDPASLTLEQIMAIREEEDYKVMERLRRRVAAIVDDPDTAEALKPYYRFLCKRPCSNDEYLPTFNRPNVTLVDVSECKGVERATAKGLVANGVEYEVDCIIYASGFEITTEISRRYAMDDDRRPRRPVAVRPLARRLHDASRDDQPWFPEPVLHRLHPGRRRGEHHRDARAAGRTHRLHHLRSGGARREDRRAQPGGRRQLGEDRPGQWRSTTRSSR